MDPRVKTVFGIDHKKSKDSESINHKSIRAHGKLIFHMLDTILVTVSWWETWDVALRYWRLVLTHGNEQLGPDVEATETILAQLGSKHARYGVKPIYFIYLGKAIREVLQNKLGDKWTDETAKAWREVYEGLSGVMIQSLVANQASS